jgi:hypothetical protein
VPKLCKAATCAAATFSAATFSAATCGTCGHIGRGNVPGIDFMTLDFGRKLFGQLFLPLNFGQLFYP